LKNSSELVEFVVDAQRIVIKSNLIFSNIVSVRKATEAAIDKAINSCVIDFSQVDKADSSALSFCLCCMRYAKRLNKQVAFEHLPAEMVSISDLVGLHHFTRQEG